MVGAAPFQQLMLLGSGFKLPVQPPNANTYPGMISAILRGGRRQTSITSHCHLVKALYMSVLVVTVMSAREGCGSGSAFRIYPCNLSRKLLIFTKSSCCTIFFLSLYFKIDLTNLQRLTSRSIH